MAPDAVRRQLDRILASHGFVQTERTAPFLRFVVEETLAGRGDRLKEYSIAVEVFGRDDGFDPQTSSVVRVEASRLRTKLDNYYRDAGANDPVLIELPRGRYTPVFKTPQTAEVGFSDNPSIAILPFTNMSNDREQDYFSAGITEDIITALSRVRLFPVIARNSTFAYRDTAVDVRTVARELGARYVMEGSVRKAGNRVRVTAQLIDGETGNHIWADRYDRELNDIFALQDELTVAIVGAIEPEMGRAEQERVERKPPQNLDAWDCYHQGMASLHRRTKDDMGIARGLFRKAMSLDGRFAPAYSAYSRTFSFDILFGFTDGGHDDALRAARQAVDLDLEHADGHLALSTIHYLDDNFVEALREVEMAVRFNPSYAAAHHLMGTILAHSGRPEEALPHLHAAIRLSPRDAEIAPFHARVAMAHLYLRNHEEAAEWGAKAVRLPGVQWPGHCTHVAALAHLGRTGDAQRALDALLSFRPDVSLAFVRRQLPTIENDDKEHMLAGLRKAGLPE
jgi:TolB-like protein